MAGNLQLQMLGLEKKSKINDLRFYLRKKYKVNPNKIEGRK